MIHGAGTATDGAHWLRTHGYPGDWRMRLLDEGAVARALAWSPTANLVVSGAGFFPHARQHDLERPDGIADTVVHVCTHGSGWVSLDGAPGRRIRRGDVIVLPPGRPHEYRADPDDPWTMWWFHVQGPIARQLTAASTDSGSVFRLNAPDISPLVDAARAASRILSAPDTAATLIAAAGYGWRALTLLAADRAVGPVACDARVRFVREHLEANLGSPASIPVLAAATSLSASHLTKVFRDETGMPILEYLKRARMERARTLLAETDDPIASIAGAVGYLDAPYFSRVFREATGAAPSAYRADRRVAKSV